MPTGYTEPVQKGEITELSDFALLCARAFGALVTMRDEPLSKPVPQEFEVDPGYQTRLDDAVNKQAEFWAMSESEKLEMWEAERVERLNYARNGIKEKEEQAKRYKAMLAKVEAWKPPTGAHWELAEFMKEQLQGSIEFECNTSVYNHIILTIPNFEEWKHDKQLSLAARVTHCEHLLAEEVERVNGRNQWLKQLRDSLAKVQA